MPLPARPATVPALAPTARPSQFRQSLEQKLPPRPRRGTAAARETGRFGSAVADHHLREKAAAIAAEHEERDHYERVVLDRVIGINVAAFLDEARAKYLPNLSASQAYGQALHRLSSEIITDASWVDRAADVVRDATPQIRAERSAQQHREHERRTVRTALARGGRRADELIAELLVMPGNGAPAEPTGELRIVQSGGGYKLDSLPQPGSISRRITAHVAGDTWWMVQHVCSADNLNVPPSALAVIAMWGLEFYLRASERSLSERENVISQVMMVRAHGGITQINAELHRCAHCGHISLEK